MKGSKAILKKGQGETLENTKNTNTKPRSVGRSLRSLLALFLSMIMVVSSIPVQAFAFAGSDNERDDLAPAFTQEAIDLMQEVCGDGYNAEDVLTALYLMGAVDRNGMPILENTFRVNGKNVTADELRAMANSHLTDKEDETVEVDGEVFTWSQIRSLFAISDMNAYVTAAKDMGIALNDEAHIEIANSLIKWLATGGENGDDGDEDGWHKVTHVDHYGTLEIGKNTGAFTSSAPVNPNLYYRVWDDETSSYVATNTRFTPSAKYKYNNQDVTFGSTSSYTTLEDMVASRSTPTQANRLWFPTFPKDATFYAADGREATLYIKDGDTTSLYSGEYGEMTSLSFFVHLDQALVSSGYVPEQVKIILHSASEEAIETIDVGTATASFYYATYNSSPRLTSNKLSFEEVSSRVITDEDVAAMLGDGLEVCVIDMEEYRENVINSVYLDFILRASDDKENSDAYFLPEDLYFTFEVIGEKVAPAATNYNTRLWVTPVEGTEDTYQLDYDANPDIIDTADLGYRISSWSRNITLENSPYLKTVQRKDYEGNTYDAYYIDLYDNVEFISDYVLNGNRSTDILNKANMDMGDVGRLFLDHVDGTEYTLDAYRTSMNFNDDLWAYALKQDQVYDVPDSVIRHSLTYSFIDYPRYIPNFSKKHGNLKVGTLSVSAGSASQSVTFNETSVYSHNPPPTLLWDSASNTLTSFSDYGRNTVENVESLTVNYSSDGRAVLVQSRFLNFLRRGYEALYDGSVSYKNYLETDYVISQYAVYNKDNGTEYPHYFFMYDSSNPSAEVNLHVTGPAMTYYPGDVIPLVVRNDNGVFGYPEGDTDAERKEWASEFRLTVNGRSLEPAEMTFRKGDDGTYGVDMLVFLYEVGEFEAGRIDFEIGHIKLSFDDESYNVLSGLDDDDNITMMTPDWRAILLIDDFELVTEDGNTYLEFPIRSDLTLAETEVLYNQLNTWTRTGLDPIKNMYALFDMTGHPNSAERTPLTVKTEEIDGAEIYTAVRIQLPSIEENGGDPMLFVRIYDGVQLPDAYFKDYNGGIIIDGYPTVGLVDVDGVSTKGHVDGFEVSDPLYRPLTTIVVRLPETTYFEDESDFTLIYNEEWAEWASGLKYRVYKKEGKPAIALSYNFSSTNDEGAAYTYTGAQSFSWSSSNESIAMIENTVIDGKTIGIVIPTGITGTVTFTLTAYNGDDPTSSAAVHRIEIESLEMTVVEDSPEAYIEIPELLTPVIVRRNEAASISFASNVQQANALGGQDSTDFTLNVYEAEASGGVLVKSSDTPVYTKTVTATTENPVCSIRVPEDIFDIVSPLGSESYLAEVSAVCTNEEKLPEGNTDGKLLATVPIKVKNYPIRLTLTSEDNIYMLGGDIYTAAWTVENANDSYDWRYYVTDELGNVISEYSSAGTGTFDKKTLVFTAPEVTDVLKRTYTLTVAAGNNLAEEGWTLATKTLYVYNRDALDILVNGVENKVVVSDDGDVITMDSRAWLSQYLSEDGKTVVLGDSSIGFGELQTDTHLDAAISLNYGDYSWGLISDAIEWVVTDEDGTDPIDLYYSKMGIFSDTSTSGLSNYLPTTDFRLIAVRDGEVTITARHARSGLSSSVKVNVDVLDHELILFQFYPAAVTYLTYTLTDGTEVTVASEANGQLALYEAAGIDDSTRLYVRSEYNGSEYVGMTTMSEMKSGEKNAANGKTYPVNLVKLQKPAEVRFFFNDAEGSPVTGDFTVRGGVYYNGEYVAAADLFNSSNKSDANIGDPDVSNGLEDQTYTSDVNGMISIFFNMEQFTASGEINYARPLLYIFEVRAEGYRPEILVVNPYMESTKVIGLTEITAEEEEKPFLIDVTAETYYDGHYNGDLTIESTTVNIGPNLQNRHIVLASETFLWGLTDLIDRTSGVSVVITEPGSQFYTDEGTTTLLGDGATEDYQTYRFWCYPFSSFAICDTEIVEKPDTLDWVEEKTPVPMDLVLFDAAGEEVANFPFKYALYKSYEAEEPVENENSELKAKEQAEKIKEVTEDFGLGTLLPGGDILEKGMTLLTSCASGGDYGVHFQFCPTADPATYYIMITLSNEEPEADDDDPKEKEKKEREEKYGKIELEYGDIQNYGQEIIAAMRGSQVYTRDFSSQKKGIQDVFNKELDDIYEVGSEKKKEDKKDDDDDEDHSKILIGGTLMACAKYNVYQDDWNIDIVGGGVDLKFIYENEWHKNLIIGWWPVTLSFGVKAEIGGGISGRTVHIPEDPYEDHQVLYSAFVGGELEGFAGLGFDLGIVTAKIGFYGTFGVRADLQTLMSRGNTYFGANFNLKGEVGIKAKFKALVATYEYEICSFAHIGKDKDKGVDYPKGSYETIQKYWTGKDDDGNRYLAVATSEGTQYAITRMAMTPAYLAPATQPGYTFLKTFGDGEELEEIHFSDDGKKIFYLDDGVAFIATAAGITEGAISPDEENDYGQFYLDAAGSNGNYAAVWVTQTQPDVYDDYYEATPADLAAALNSTEITAAICKDGVWTTTRLTDNTAPDVAPTVAVSEDGKYVVVAWRSVYNSNPDAPLTFDVDDNLVFRVWNSETETWSDPQTAFNGIANGSIYALDSAVFNNGSVLLAYNVQTPVSEETENGLEAFYTFLENTADGMTNTTVRASENKVIDSNAQLLKITEDDEEYVVLGWYNGDEKGDICLRVFDDEGNIDETYPSSIAAMSDVRIGEIFRLAGSSKDNLVIGWINAKKADGADVASADLCAVRVYSAADGSYLVAPTQTLAESSASCAVDDFALFAEGIKVTAILSETDYSDGETKVAASFTLEDMVRPELYETEEAYNDAVAMFNDLYPTGVCTVEVPVGYYKADLVEAEFKNEITVEKIRYNQNTVAPFFNVPVQFTVKNSGYTPIDSLTVNGETFTGLNLIPGATTKITVNYEMDGAAHDDDYVISVPGDLGFEAVADTIHFNTPEILIKDSRQTKAENGTRTFVIRLGNANMVPAATADRSYLVTLCSDSACAYPISDSILLTDDQISLLDDGAAVVPFTFDVQELMKDLGMEGSEIPASGLPVFVRVDTLDGDNNVLETARDTVMLTSQCADPENLITVEFPAFTVGDGCIEGTYKFTNTSIYDAAAFYGIALYDVDGQMIAMKLLAPELDPESTVSGTYSIPMIDPSRVASVKLETLTSKAFPESVPGVTGSFSGWSAVENASVSVGSNDLAYILWDDGVEVSIIEGIKYGTVTTDVTMAGIGSTITFNVEPKEGYKLDYLSIDTSNWDNYMTSDPSFTIPEGSVYVKVFAYFVKDNTVVHNNTASLLLEDTIGLLLRLDAASYGVSENLGVVKLTYDHSKGPKSDVSTDVIPLNEAVKESDGRFKFAIDLAPAQITETIKIELYENSDATDPIYEQEYSVADYLTQVVEEYPEMAKLSKALLAYGAACQAMFEVNTDNLADPKYKVKSALSDASDVGDYTLTEGATGMNLKSMTLEVQNRTAVRFYFELEEGASVEDYTVNLVTDATKTYAAAEIVQAGKKCYIAVTGIEAPNLNMLFTLTVTNVNDDTVTEISNFCALNYAKVVLEAAPGDAAEDLARALCFYSKEADAYFGM